MSLLFLSGLLLGAGGGGGATSAGDLSVDPKDLKVITSDNAQGAFEELDAEAVRLQGEITSIADSVSKLKAATSLYTTTTELSTTVGETTTVQRDNITPAVPGNTIDVSVGALVFGPEAVTGIVVTAEASNANVEVKTISTADALEVKEW